MDNLQTPMEKSKQSRTKAIAAVLVVILIIVMLQGWFSYAGVGWYFEDLGRLRFVRQNAQYTIHQLDHVTLIQRELDDIRVLMGRGIPHFQENAAQYKEFISVVNVVRAARALGILLLAAFLFLLAKNSKKSTILGISAAFISALSAFILIYYIDFRDLDLLLVDFMLGFQLGGNGIMPAHPSIWAYLSLLLSVVFFAFIAVKRKKINDKLSLPDSNMKLKPFITVGSVLLLAFMVQDWLYFYHRTPQLLTVNLGFPLINFRPGNNLENLIMQATSWGTALSVFGVGTFLYMMFINSKKARIVGFISTLIATLSAMTFLGVMFLCNDNNPLFRDSNLISPSIWVYAVFITGMIVLMLIAYSKKTSEVTHENPNGHTYSHQRVGARV